MSYAKININDHTKAIIYNHAYKYNSNKRAYKYGVIHLYTSNKSSTQEWEDPHLGRGLVFGGGHESDTSHSNQLSLVVFVTPRVFAQ